MRTEKELSSQPLPRLAIALMLLICGVLLTPLQAADKPNFVIIFIDDMGYGDIGPFGSNLNRTPNLDRMADEGMRLTSFYAAPVCSASRAQLMTGSYAPRVSVPGVFFPAGRLGLNPEEHTVADYLRDLGYATMCVGKWHLGDQREFLPTKHGFDGYLGIPYSNDMQRVAKASGKRVHPLVRDTEVAELLEDEQQRRVTREYTEEAVKFLEANTKQQFFLYLPHTAMHVPLFPHADFVGRSKNGTYGDWVEEVDWSVGQILAALKRLKLEENTLVLFTSDNGPWASKGKAGGVSGPLRGSKGCTLEGGVRVPTIVRWPGKIAPGTTSDAIAGTTDVLPTFVSLAGGAPKKDVKIDGVDISKHLLGRRASSGRKEWYYFQGTRLQAVRSGPWKLAMTSQSLGMGIKEKAADLSKADRLYNLGEEIGETTDRAADHPEIVARLRKLGERMANDVAENKRPAGEVENPVTLYPTEPRKARPSTKKAKPGKAITWTKAKLGDVFAPSSAPAVAGKPFLISCTVAGENPQGVIVAHGGSAVGYSLYTKDGRLIFAIRSSSSGVQRVSRALGSGRCQVSASLSKDGLMTLSVDGSHVKSEQTVGLLNRHPQEDLCIGHDNRNPVDPEAPAGSWTGELTAIKISIGK
jgi:arylsulfatase A